MKEHNKQLASAAKGAGVIDPIDYAIFKIGDIKGFMMALIERAFKEKKGLKKR
jgi:DNA-damage-inducible protein D